MFCDEDCNKFFYYLFLLTFFQAVNTTLETITLILLPLPQKGPINTQVTRPIKLLNAFDVASFDLNLHLSAVECGRQDASNLYDLPVSIKR